MAYQCELKQKPAQPVLSIRTRTAVQDLREVLGKSYGSIMGYLMELGEQPVDAPFTAYYNMDMQDLDVEIGFPVGKALPTRGEIQASTMPEGQYASCVHTGPYSAIEPAYNALNAWIAQKGLEPTGVAYEFYLNDPTETPPEALQTRIVFPLKGD